MAKQLTVNNTTYNYPEAGEDPGWGPEATGWAEEVTAVLNSLLGVGDILETTDNIANNQTSVLSISKLAFDTGTVRSAVVDYSVYRVTDTVLFGNVETGQLTIVYDNSAGAGDKWILVQQVDGDAGITFSITDAGQFQYTSTNISGSEYSGVIKFKAKTLAQ